MPHPATPPAQSVRWLTRLAAALSLLLLAAGCRSAQSAYQFRPAAGVAAAELWPASAEAPTPPDAGRSQPVALVVEVPPTSAPRVAVAREVRREISKMPARQLRRWAGRARAASVTYAAVHPRQHPHPGGAQATAEAGLGTTVLGVLGLVVGPIALLGLLIWGGPVWAILAALAVLAVLVAYIDPFR